jgi:hypothetical protein
MRKLLVIWTTVLLLSSLGVGSAVATRLIDSRDIRNFSIRAVDLGRGSVTSQAIADNTVRDRDLSPALRSQLGIRVANGKDGVAGANGTNGRDGANGAAGAAGRDGFGTVNVNEAGFTAPAGADPVEGHVACDPGLRALGGGVEPVNAAALAAGDFSVVASYPSAGDRGWTALVENNNPDTEQVRIHVICAPVAPGP